MLIVFAHPLEAQPSLDRLKAIQVSENLWECERGKIVITGMGCVNAAKQTALHGQNAETILNLGIVGALHDHLPAGALHTISTIGKENELPISTGHDGWRLVTCDQPVWNKNERDCLGKHYDVVDMEGYAIASTAKELGIPCTLWKIISDHASEGGQADLKRRITPLSEQLAEILIQQ